MWPGFKWPDIKESLAVMKNIRELYNDGYNIIYQVDRSLPRK
jgi:hypothetical protein